ncbi:MAG: hypothetical protein IM638_08700 [Bacteroidetes bacterium]|nr:hypothetical protein [Bacteroidota bacterium]
MFQSITSRLLFVLALFFFSAIQTGLTRYAAQWAGVDDELVCLISEKAEESEKNEAGKDGKETKEAVDDMLVCLVADLSVPSLLSKDHIISLENSLADSYTGHPTSPPPECA